VYAEPGGGVVAGPPDLSDDGEVTMSSRTICSTHGIDGPQWDPVAYDDEDEVDDLERLIEDEDLLEDDEFFDDEDDDLEDDDDLDDEDAEDF
jgi:hypothetical protein